MVIFGLMFGSSFLIGSATSSAVGAGVLLGLSSIASLLSALQEGIKADVEKSVLSALKQKDEDKEDLDLLNETS